MTSPRRDRAASARVVIAAHNAAGFLAETLHSLVEQDTPDPFEVVVVASACTDGTAGIARGFADRLRVNVVATARAGGNVARNLGAAQAGAPPHLLFLDHDDCPEPGWVRHLLATLQRADVALGRYRVDRLNSANTLALRGPVDFADAPTEYDPSTLTGRGGNSAYRTTAWRQLGGLDEHHHHVDDVEILWRAHDLGMTIEFATDAEVQYRLRPTAFAYFEQYVNRYIGWAHLHRLYPARVPRRRLRHALRQWAWVLAHLPRAFSKDPATKGSWVRPAARIVGSVRGSLRYRTLFL